MLLDEYDAIPRLNANWQEVLASGGFAVNSPQFDENVYNPRKNHLGRMPFRILGVDSNGAPLKVSRDEDGEIRKRVVRGGTWRSTGDFRSYISEDQHSPTVGFRCILPYTGIPVDRKYKVKW